MYSSVSYNHHPLTSSYAYPSAYPLTSSIRPAVSYAPLTSYAAPAYSFVQPYHHHHPVQFVQTSYPNLHNLRPYSPPRSAEPSPKKPATKKAATKKSTKRSRSKSPKAAKK